MPKHYTYFQLRKALLDYGVNAVFEKGWDSERIDPYHENFTPVGFLLHHTAGRNSLSYCMGGTFPPVRNCHFLCDRDGTIHVLAGSGCYHAGLGGPLTVGDYTIPKNMGNQHFWGVEIESLGTEAGVTDTLDDKSPNGMTPQQVESVARLAAAVLNMMGTDESALFRHKDWAPSRKIDVKQPLSFWRDQVKEALDYQHNEDLYAVLAKAYIDPQVKNNATHDLAVVLKELGYYTGEVQPVGRQGFPRVALTKFKSSHSIPNVGYTRETHKRLFGA
jgi:hypothetical protein